MSKITLEPNNSGTGTFTIAAPNSNTNRTLTLPDEAGTALTDTTDLEPQVKTSLNATGDAPLYACRAWVQFDDDNPPIVIKGSGNVSSVTELSTGTYQVNFSTAMPDDDYAGLCTSQRTSGDSIFDSLSFTTTSFIVRHSEITDGPTPQFFQFSAAVFR